MTYCPECGEVLKVNTPCENCERLYAEAAVALCSACRFGGEPCICGDSPDYRSSEDPSMPDYMYDDDDDWDDEDNDYDDEDVEYALGNCAMRADGFCGHAGSEYCDFDCPFNQ